MKKILILFTALLIFNTGFSQELSKEEKKQEKKERKEEKKKRKTAEKESKDLIKREALEAKTLLYQNMTSINFISYTDGSTNMHRADYNFNQKFGISENSSKQNYLGTTGNYTQIGTFYKIGNPIKKSKEYQNEIININKYDYFKFMHLRVAFRTEKVFYGLLAYKYDGVVCEKLINIYDFRYAYYNEPTLDYLLLEYQSEVNDTSLSHKIILKSEFVTYNEMLNNNIIALNLLKKEEFTSLMIVDTTLENIEIKNKLHPVISQINNKFMHLVYSQKEFLKNQEIVLSREDKKWVFGDTESDFRKITHKLHASNIKLGLNKIDFELDSLKIYKLNFLKFYEYIFDKETATNYINEKSNNFYIEQHLTNKIASYNYKDLKKMCDKNYWENLIPKEEDFILNFLDEVNSKASITLLSSDTNIIKQDHINFGIVVLKSEMLKRRDAYLNPNTVLIRDLCVEDLWLKSVAQFNFLEKNEKERREKEKNQKDYDKYLKKFDQKYVDEAQNGNIVVGMPEGLLPIPLRVWNIKSNTQWSKGYRIYCSYKFDTSRKLIVYVYDGKVESISNW